MNNPPNAAGAEEVRLEWAPWGVALLEIGASFERGNDQTDGWNHGGRVFSRMALACVQWAAMAPEKRESIPPGVWRSWMDKSGARSEGWERLTLVETPLGVVPVALIQGMLPEPFPTVEAASDAIRGWVDLCDRERAPDLRRSFLAPKFARLIAVEPGDDAQDTRAARRVVAVIVADHEADAMSKTLKEAARARAEESAEAPSAAVADLASPPALASPDRPGNFLRPSPGASAPRFGDAAAEGEPEDWGDDDALDPKEEAPRENAKIEKIDESSTGRASGGRARRL